MRSLNHASPGRCTFLKPKERCLLIREIRRGDIYDAAIPEEVVGSEQAGKRPVVIIQADWLNRTSTNVKFAVITSRIKRLDLPTHYLLPNLRGLDKTSMVLGEHTGTMDKSRLQKYRCTLNPKTMKLVDRAVRNSIRDRRPKRGRRNHRLLKRKRLKRMR